MHERWWRLIVIVGIVGGVGETLLAIGDPGVIVFGLLFLMGAALAYRTKIVGVLTVGVLSLAEVVFVPFYPRDSTGDWIIQIAFAVIGIVGVVAAVGVFRERRRSRSAATA